MSQNIIEQERIITMINKTNIYEQFTALPYLSAYQQLIQGAIELDVFSNLEKPVTTKELSEKMNWDEGNTFNLLKGLYSLGYLERKGDTFCNMPETAKYLVKGKPAYIVDILIMIISHWILSLIWSAIAQPFTLVRVV